MFDLSSHLDGGVISSRPFEFLLDPPSAHARSISDSKSSFLLFRECHRSDVIKLLNRERGAEGSAMPVTTTEGRAALRIRRWYCNYAHGPCCDIRSSF